MRKSRFWLAVAIILCLFVFTRAVLNLGLTPFFDWDTYKYLGAADSLWAGQGWPPIFTSGKVDGKPMAVIGGLLHIMPGYVGFILLTWMISGGITITGICVLQSVLCLIAYSLAAYWVGRTLGRTVGLLVLAVLTLSPTTAFLEHMVMPGGLATACVMVSMALAGTASPRDEPPGRYLPGAGLAGLGMAIAILLRTSSTAYVPLPALLVLWRPGRWRATALWLGLYTLTTVLPLVPWALHNHNQHGIFALSASTGRNLYFSAAWGNTIDRAAMLRLYGIERPSNPRDTFMITRRELMSLLAGGLTMVEADAELRRRALEAYRGHGLLALLQQRHLVLFDLFDLGDTIPGRRSLRGGREWYFSSPHYSSGPRQHIERTLGYVASKALVEGMERDQTRTRIAESFVSRWVTLATLEGIPLLVGFLVSVAILLLRGREQWPFIIGFAAPPLAFLAMYTFFGAPTYRYQFQLHPFMQVTILLAICTVFAHARTAQSRSRPVNEGSGRVADESRASSPGPR
ncbi:MAG: hypothetical protein E4H03_03255 [Myxococcales bacterium]|jgi:hypothetical protein|nr:MAG: hypothetical protein E4H03_03255 [Myxococcales bacterium]